MLTRITIEVTPEQKQQIKILAALKKVSVKDLILERTIGLEEKEQSNSQNLSGHELDQQDVEKGKRFKAFWNNDS